MAHVTLDRLALARHSFTQELSKLGWILIFGVAKKSLACWIDGLD
jgi:hypothetical protein